MGGTFIGTGKGRNAGAVGVTRGEERDTCCVSGAVRRGRELVLRREFGVMFIGTGLPAVALDGEVGNGGEVNPKSS
jgi:hypothetical protein